ncbi:MAG: hypothetical protein N2114_05630 [Candidatus Goldbacteria bacterium]|nr:hypothetical protein [Candidatus Goldiibacteriota bacterium]
MAEGLTINVVTKGDVKVIQCRGYIDTSTSSMLEKTLEDIIKSKN